MSNNKEKNKTKSNGERGLYIAAIAVLITAAVFAALTLLLDPNRKNEDMNVGIEGVDVYYGEPIEDLVARLGEPDSVSEKDERSGEKTYYYKVNAFGISDVDLAITTKEDARYHDQVYMIYLRLFTNESEELFNRAKNRFEELYKDREGYGTSGITEFNETRFCSVYTMNDECTQSCEISLNPNFVDITAFYNPMR